VNRAAATQDLESNKHTKMKKLLFAGRLALIALGAGGLSSCSSDRGTIRDVVAPQNGAAGAVSNAQTSQRRFATPQAAVDALAAAAKAGNTNDIRAIFGPESREVVSPDAVQAATAFSNFVQRASEKVAYARQSDTNMELQLGLDAWPFPIPLVQANGQWFFDTAAGREEILNRRIGMNELAAIRVCHAYVEAQQEFASQSRNGDGVLEYAQHFRSQSGAVPRLLFPDFDPAGIARARRQIRLHHQRPHAGRIRAGGVAGGMGKLGRNDVYRQPAGQGLSEESGAKNHRHRFGNDHLRSGRDVEGGRGGIRVKHKSGTERAHSTSNAH
jgi:hypothetical protein